MPLVKSRSPSLMFACVRIVTRKEGKTSCVLSFKHHSISAPVYVISVNVIFVKVSHNLLPVRNCLHGFHLKFENVEGFKKSLVHFDIEN